MKKIAILGSTGSIGTQALDILEQYPQEYEITALTANENIDLLEKQALRFRPAKLGVVNTVQADVLRRRLPPEIEILSGKQALTEIASEPDIDIVLLSVVGISGLEAALAALESGNDVALANKETLVAGGQLVMDAARRSGARLLPIDSEHSAIFQCIQGTRPEHVRKILLTASGGPFRGYNTKLLQQVSVSDALKHPRWNMGKKVTIDSATLMNKGLEVIEAKWLFSLEHGQIEVVIHPQSIIHSMVEFVDGSVIAQMGMPDMRLPILYAFTWPERFATNLPTVDFIKLGSLTFEKPDTTLFPCLELAFEALKAGGTMPAVLNAANEVAVQKFLEEAIPFTRIPAMIERAMRAHKVIPAPSLCDILAADEETRRLLI